MMFTYYLYICNVQKKEISMKKIFLMMLAVSSAVFAFTSCSKSFDDEVNLKTRVYASEVEEARALAVPVESLKDIPQHVRVQRAAAVILSSYVTLHGDRYTLDISAEEAEKLGVTEDLYNAVKKDLDKSNESIQKAIDNGEKPNLPDVKKQAEEYKKTGKLLIVNSDKLCLTRSVQNGMIKTIGQEQGEAGFYPDMNITCVLFTCHSSAAIVPFYTCKTYIFSTWRQVTDYGSIFTYTKIVVPLAATGSGLFAWLYFSTTDSNGGVCNWVGLEKPGDA